MPKKVSVFFLLIPVDDPQQKVAAPEDRSQTEAASMPSLSRHADLNPSNLYTL